MLLRADTAALFALQSAQGRLALEVLSLSPRAQQPMRPVLAADYRWLAAVVARVAAMCLSAVGMVALVLGAL